MIIWTIASYSLIIGIASYVIFLRRPELPVLINGMIPGLPGAESKAESGSTAYIFYSNTERDDAGREIFRGYADDKGVIRATVPVASVGRPVTIRIRHAGFRFPDTQLEVLKHGLFYTARLERDGVYSRPLRGAPVADLGTHYEESTMLLERVRTDAIRLAFSLRTRIGLVPVMFWPIFYIVLIFGFALDYAANESAFNSQFESFLHAVYFSVVTITTLGYGEIYPVTDLFRILCSVEAVSGLLMVGLFLNSLFSER